MRNAPSSALDRSAVPEKVSQRLGVIGAMTAGVGLALSATAQEKISIPDQPTPIVAKAPLGPKRIEKLTKDWENADWNVRDFASRELDKNMPEALKMIVKLTRSDIAETAKRAHWLKEKHYDKFTAPKIAKYSIDQPGDLLQWPLLYFLRDMELPPNIEYLKGTGYEQSLYTYPSSDQALHGLYVRRNYRRGSKLLFSDLVKHDYLESYFVSEDRDMYMGRKRMEHFGELKDMQKKESSSEQPPCDTFNPGMFLPANVWPGQ